jgi:hypothetical protein
LARRRHEARLDCRAARSRQNILVLCHSVSDGTAVV